MISKEVLEIRKLIKKDSDSSIRVCGCYVAGNEKEKLTYINDYLSNMTKNRTNMLNFSKKLSLALLVKIFTIWNLQKRLKKKMVSNAHF